MHLESLERIAAWRGVAPEKSKHVKERELSASVMKPLRATKSPEAAARDMRDGLRRVLKVIRSAEVF